jgi:hypothetical protein
MPSNNSKIPIKLMITVLILSAVFLAISCKECPTEPEPGTVILSIAYVATQSVYLNISVSDSLNTSEIRIQRDTTTILEANIFSGDTLIIDDSLQSGKTYSYRGYLLDNGKVISSGEILPVTTMDTTDHEIYSWEIDTLGFSGEINDIWIISEDDIFAVGEFVTDSGTFNVARWNGDRWNLQLVGAIGVNCNGIYYFAEDDIWIATGILYHWNGKEWERYHLWNMGILNESDGGVEYIWGSSPNNIYFVGGNGTIVHYNGSTFRKMESGTTCNLDDIYGIDENHIWAVGTETKNTQSVILFYNGKEWQILHDTNQEDFCYSNSFWTDNTYFLFLNGGSGRYYFNIIKHEYKKYHEAGRWYGYDIDGLACNDIFASTAGSEVLHYNGSTWHLYTEIKDHFGDYYRIKTIQSKENIIVAGGYWYTGLYGLPIIIRGYRN